MDAIEYKRVWMDRLFGQAPIEFICDANVWHESMDTCQMESQRSHRMTSIASSKNICVNCGASQYDNNVVFPRFSHCDPFAIHIFILLLIQIIIYSIYKQAMHAK